MPLNVLSAIQEFRDRPRPNSWDLLQRNVEGALSISLRLNLGGGIQCELRVYRGETVSSAAYDLIKVFERSDHPATPSTIPTRVGRICVTRHLAYSVYARTGSGSAAPKAEAPRFWYPASIAAISLCKGRS